MKTIIAGGRDLADPALVAAAMDSCPWSPTEVVSGAASGVDTLGESWAKEHGIPVKQFPANWKEHPRAAGPIRNREMAKYADALVAIWGGKSRGTKSMISEAEKAGLEVHVHKVD